ncbi:MFS transporter [Compostibacter hankyongensis]|uniref:MFS transporter n=1 Tax=Compostibacter hankyongensis TaxID=1007089 RepID=A0ABP8G6B5_9BACT
MLGMLSFSGIRLNRVAAGTLFFLSGLCSSSWASRIPTIQQSMKLQDIEMGSVLMCMPVGLLASLPVSGWLITRIGSKTVAIVSAVVYGAVLVLLSLARSPVQLGLVLVLFGFCSNMLNIAMNTQAVEVELLYKRSIMASFHGMWSLASFAGAAVGASMIKDAVPPWIHFLFVGIAIAAVTCLIYRFLLPSDVKRDLRQPVFVKPDAALLQLGIIAFCSMICEGAMADWSGIYARKVAQVRAEDVGLGYAAFTATMALGRFLADGLVHRMGTARVLKLSGLLIFAGLLIPVAYPALNTVILGFLLVGAGTSSVVPLVYGIAGRSGTLSSGMALAAVSTVGYLGFLFGPPLIGFVAGYTSLRISFLVVAAMGATITVMTTRVLAAQRPS